MLKLPWMFTAFVVISFACPSQAKELSGKVEKDDAVNRIERPNSAPNNLAGKAESGKVDLQNNDFLLQETKDNVLPPLNTKFDTEVKAPSKPIEKPKPIDKTDSGSGRNTIVVPPIANPAKQVIIVRLIYHMIDEQNFYNAAKMCMALHGNGAEVILMLDKEATRISSRHLSGQMIARNERIAHSVPEIVRSTLAGGVRVVAAKDWANDFGVNEGNAIAGVEFLTTDQLASEIVRSAKILDY